MSTDPFDELLELENDFYKEGFEAGVADSAFAGLIEGKLFGIEKGYEKALEIGKTRGRSLVWQQRLANDSKVSAESACNSNDEKTNSIPDAATDLSDVMSNLSPLPNNRRPTKHIDFLISVTDPASVPKDNSDESVSEVDERITKIKARMKMMSNWVGEAVSPTSRTVTGIEDATGLSARH